MQNGNAQVDNLKGDGYFIMQVWPGGLEFSVSQAFVNCNYNVSWRCMEKRNETIEAYYSFWKFPVTPKALWSGLN